MSDKLSVERLIHQTPRSPLYLGTISTALLVPVLRVGFVPVRVGSLYVMTTGPSAVKGTSADHWQTSVEGAANDVGTQTFLNVPIRSYISPLRSQFWTELLVNHVLQNETLFVRFTPVGSPSAIVDVSVTFSAEVR